MADLNALTGQDTLTMVVEGVITLITLTGIGLKVAGKNVPIIDTLLTLLKGVAKTLPKKEPEPLPPPSDPAKEPGLAAVIELKPEDKKPEQP